MTIRLRVAILDPRRLIREGLAQILSAEPDIEVVVVAAGSDQAAAGSWHAVDVVLRGDADRPHPWPTARVVRLTGTEPAAGVIAATRGEVPMQIGHNRSPLVPEPRPIGLTPREIEVLRAMSEGLPTDEIAERLGLARKSVDNYKQRLYAKLGAGNAAHAVAIGRRTGLLESMFAGDQDR